MKPLFAALLCALAISAHAAEPSPADSPSNRGAALQSAIKEAFPLAGYKFIDPCPAPPAPPPAGCIVTSPTNAEPAADPVGCTLGPGDVCIEPPQPIPQLATIPTLSERGLIGLTLVMGGLVAFGAARASNRADKAQ